MKLKVILYKEGDYYYYEDLSNFKSMWLYPDGSKMDQLEEYAVKFNEKDRYNSLEIDDGPPKDCYFIRDAICIRLLDPPDGTSEKHNDMLENEIDIGGFEDFIYNFSKNQIQKYAIELLSTQKTNEAIFLTSWEFSSFHSYWDSDYEPDIQFSGFVTDFQKWKDQFEAREKQNDGHYDSLDDVEIQSAAREWNAVVEREEKLWPRGGMDHAAGLNPVPFGVESSNLSGATNSCNELQPFIDDVHKEWEEVQRKQNRSKSSK